MPPTSRAEDRQARDDVGAVTGDAGLWETDGGGASRKAHGSRHRGTMWEARCRRHKKATGARRDGMLDGLASLGDLWATARSIVSPTPSTIREHL